jgi:DNA-binding PadR family transcriptional regulator
MENELLLLGILRKQDMHGYQLAEFIDHYLSTCTDMKKPTAYFLLDKMTAAGWVTFEQIQEGKRPPRRVYHLMPDGEAAFQQLLRANLATYQAAAFSSDTGLAFLDALSTDEARQLLAQRRQEIEKLRASLQAAPPHGGTLSWIIEHQLRHLSAEAEWVDELMVRLANSESHFLKTE